MTPQTPLKSRHKLPRLLLGLLAGAAAYFAAPVLTAHQLTGDGKVDAVVTQKQRFNQVCYGDGTGALTQCVDVKGLTLNDQINTTKAKLLDWNGDGAPDIVFAMEGHASVVCINDGGGNFNNVNSGVGCYQLYGYTTFPYDSEDVAVGDIDGDGVADLVFANGGNAGNPQDQPNLVCTGFNTGASSCNPFPGAAHPSTGVALGDVNGDGRLDAVFSNRGARNTVCLNLGGGATNFDCRDITPAAGVADTKVSNAVAIGNLAPGYGGTPDGSLDIVFANNGPNEYCFGNGDWSGANVGLDCGKFNPVSSYTTSDANATSLSVVVANILPTAPHNGAPIHQGDEIVFGNSDTPNVFCFDTFVCTYQFQPSHIVNVNIGGTIYSVSEPIPETTNGVSVADVNGDGKLDVVVANAGVSRTYFLNTNATNYPPTGSFAFTLAPVDANTTWIPTSIALGDVGGAADKTPPEFIGASNFLEEATGPAGAPVTLTVTASDDVDGSVPVTCSPSSGSVFPLGNTPVTCSATDNAGNTGTASFTVTVRDTTPPVMTLPSDIAITLTTATSVVIDYNAYGGVSATDLVSGSVPVICSPASGSAFSAGQTSVNCMAQDAAGYQARNSFLVTVTVVNNTQPSANPVTVPAGSGTSVTFGGVSSTGLTTSTPIGIPQPGPLPGNFGVSVVNTWFAYEVSTTATVTAPIVVCFTLPQPNSISAAAFNNLRIFHLEGGPSGQFVDRTILRGSGAPAQYHPDPITQTVCAQTSSLSPFVIAEADTVAPAISQADVIADATDAAGVAVSFAPTVSDNVTAVADIAVSCSITSGSTFPVGTTPVTCTATDAAANQSQVSFNVIVNDKVPPVVTTPANISVEATSTHGAIVTFTATATDNADAAITPTCSPASGTAFPIGTTNVTCTATDAAGNSSSSAFDVVVTDTTPPVLSLTNVTVQATSGTTAIVDYSAKESAADIADGPIALNCSPASGTAFPIGTTTVDCSAEDAHHNTSTGSFTVTVTDGVPPVVTVPADLTAEATSGAGATVTFSASAIDSQDGARPTTCLPASGSAFPVGTTTVNCSATDAAGNTGSASFMIAVTDTTPPVVIVPAPISATAGNPGGVPVAFSASAVDAVDGARPVSCVPASGSTFPVGSTTVNCGASDTRGNSVSGSFTVTVTLVENRISRFVAFSRDSTVLMKGATVVSGDVGANAARSHRRDKSDDGDRDDVTVKLGDRVTMQAPDSRVVGDTVQLGNGASVFNVVDNFLLNRRGTVLGAITSPMTMPYLDLPAFPTVAAGTQRIKVTKQRRVVLPPGAYGDVQVEDHATLVLTGGIYQIRSLDVDDSGTVLLQGATEMRIARSLEAGQKSRIVLDQTVPGLSASQMVFYVAGGDADDSHRGDRDNDGGRGNDGRRDNDGHNDSNGRKDNDDARGTVAARVGEQSVVQATIYAQNGTVWLMAQTRATGQFIGVHVLIGENVTLTLGGRF